MNLKISAEDMLIHQINNKLCKTQSDLLLLTNDIENRKMTTKLKTDLCNLNKDVNDIIEKIDEYRRNKIKMFLTVCFYEYPAAKAHLDYWEKAMVSRILEKIEFVDHSISYFVSRDKVGELVYCTPIQNMNQESFRLSFQTNTQSQFHSYQYLKTLIFGKINETCCRS